MNTNGNNRVRWTDKQLDQFADSVIELRESVAEQRESIYGLRDYAIQLRDDIIGLREGMVEANDSIDGLRVTAQTLLQVAAQHQQAEGNTKTGGNTGSTAGDAAGAAGD